MRNFRFVAMVLWICASASAGVVEDSGVQGGIVVQVGCKDAQALAGLRIHDSFLVHGLDRDAANVSRIRQGLQSRGAYGPVSVARYDGKTLPYTDNLVNLLIVAESPCRIPRQEMLRALAPGGVVVVGGTNVTKPVPDEIDEWTHFLHGPDNNAVANDTVISSPRSIQWVAKPRWARSHEEAASPSALVAAGGRLFGIMDEAPNVSIRFMAHWSLVARDAFNGTLLWKRPIPRWSDHLRHFRAGPAHLPRRLVAVGEKVYVTLGLAEPVSVLDGATGKTIRVLKGTEHTEEIVVADGVAYLVAGTSEVYRRGGGLHARGEPDPTDFRNLLAVNTDSGGLLWKKSFSGERFLLPLSLAVRGGHVFYQDIGGVGCLDAASGKELWRTPRPSLARRMSFSAPTVVATDDVLLVADRVAKTGSAKPEEMPATDRIEWGVHGWNEPGFARRRPSLLVAYGVRDGSVLWQRPCSETYNSPVDVFVVGDRLHVSMGWTSLDLKTGQPAGPQVKMTGSKVGMAHHRCYRNKASVRYVFTGRSGIELADLKTGWVGNNSWIRGTCQYGILPANGMLYAPPNACGCFNKVKVLGFFAATPARPKGPARIDDASRIEKGPAYGQASGGSASGPEDWPTHRGNGERSGSVATAVAGTLNRAWSAKLNGRLTQPVAVGETVYVAETDAHAVCAFGAADGKLRWRHTAGGRIDSPPTIHDGAVLFGSADGVVTCLRASDGAVAWRFQAAPERRLVSSYGQLESAWPVRGAVLVQGGALYTVAGRNTYLDGGLRLYKLDPARGKVLARRVLYNFDPETGKQIGAPERSFDMDGVSNAILSGDGENVFLKQERFDASLVPGARDVPHLFGIHGFLGEEWFVRSYWLMGTNVRVGWGGWASGNETTFGRILAFDKDRIYGYGRVRIASGPTGHKADAYQLYAAKKLLMKTGLTRARRRKGPKPAKPTAKRPAKGEPFWADPNSLIVRAMVLTRDKLVVAGPPDVRKKHAGILAYVNEDESLAAFRGERGVVLRVLGSANGKTVSEQTLDAMPVFDGMIAARGRMYLSLKNGHLECWK